MNSNKAFVLLLFIYFGIICADRHTKHPNKKYANLMYVQANELYAAGNLELAVSKYREAIHFDPQNGAAYTNLGSALLDLEKTDEAIQAYEIALDIDPENADAAYNLALVHHGARDEKKSIELYKQALRSSPERTDAWMNLASCFHAIGDIDKSIFAYNKVLEKMSSKQDDDSDVKARVHEYLGRALLRKRDTLKTSVQVDGGENENDESMISINN